jgi:hypothetical protein
MNLQVIASPDGDILWVSGAVPGSGHDKKAEWIWGVLAELEAADLVTLAIRATRAQRTRRSRTGGRNPASARTPSSRPRILRKLCCCPWRAGQLAKAIHALEIRIGLIPLAVCSCGDRERGAAVSWLPRCAPATTRRPRGWPRGRVSPGGC